ncbi:MAG: GNAT family N-acetyltransferase [Pseudomonadales bacterium]
MPPARLRDARPQDAAALSDLAFRAKAHWGYDDAFMAACRAELTYAPADIDRAKFRVAEIGGEIAGFYALAANPDTFGTDALELDALFVAPDAIGRGIGATLMRAAIEQASGLGARRLMIQADPNAAGFYEHCGARQVGSLESLSIPGRQLPLLELALAAPDD